MATPIRAHKSTMSTDDGATFCYWQFWLPTNREDIDGHLVAVLPEGYARRVEELHGRLSWDGAYECNIITIKGLRSYKTALKAARSVFGNKRVVLQ